MWRWFSNVCRYKGLGNYVHINVEIFGIAFVYLICQTAVSFEVIRSKDWCVLQTKCNFWPSNTHTTCKPLNNIDIYELRDTYAAHVIYYYTFVWIWTSAKVIVL